MAALWPSLMWPPVLAAFYHAKTGVQKDFTMKLCLGEIMGGKAHKMIIQYQDITIKIFLLLYLKILKICSNCIKTLP